MNENEPETEKPEKPRPEPSENPFLPRPDHRWLATFVRQLIIIAILTAIGWCVANHFEIDHLVQVFQAMAWTCVAMSVFVLFCSFYLRARANKTRKR